MVDESDLDDNQLARTTELLSSFVWEKARMLASVGFAGMRRQGRRCKLDDDFSLWLLRKLDAERMIVSAFGSVDLPIKAVDVNLVLGIPFEGQKLEYESNVSPGVMREIRRKLLLADCTDGITLQYLELLLHKDYDENVTSEEEDAFKIAVVLYAMGYLLAVRGNKACIPIGLLNSLVDTSMIDQWNWAAYLLNVLGEAALEVQTVAYSGGSKLLVGGCMLFLQVFYLDNLDFGIHRVKHIYVPRVGACGDLFLAALVDLDRRHTNGSVMESYGITKVLRREEVCYSRGFPNELFRSGVKKCLATLEEVVTSSSAQMEVELKELISSFVEKAQKKLVDKMISAVRSTAVADDCEHHGEIAVPKVLKVKIYGSFEDGVACNVRKRFRSFGGCCPDRRGKRLDGAGISRLSVANTTIQNDVDNDGIYGGSTPELQGPGLSGGIGTSCIPIHRSLLCPGGSTLTSLELLGPNEVSEDVLSCGAESYAGSSQNTQIVVPEMTGSSNFSGAVYKRRRSVVAGMDGSGGVELSIVPYGSMCGNQHVGNRTGSNNLSIVPYRHPRSHIIAAKKVLTYCSLGTAPSFNGYHLSSPARKKSKVFFKELEAGDGLPCHSLWFDHKSPWPINITGDGLREQFKRGGVFTVDLCDALMRLNNQLEHKTCSNSRKHCRCFLPASFVGKVLSGADYLNSKDVSNLFIGSEMGYDFEHCRYVIAPVLLSERWSCYVWDLVAYNVCVLDPTMMNGTEEKAEDRHLTTSVVITKALVKCVNMFFDGWTLPEGDWEFRANTTISGRSRWRNSGMYSIHYSKWYDGLRELEKQISDVDLGEIRGEMLYQLLKMDGNDGQLPALMVA